MGQSSVKQGVDLSEEMVARLTKNTKYTPEQIEQWHQAFLRDCPTGKLNPRQFQEVFKKFYPENEAKTFTERIFRTFDLDKNGFIDFVEFLMAIHVSMDKDVNGKLGLAFDVYDINGNGKIDKKEMTRVITAIYDLLGEENRKGDNAPDNRVKRIMQKLDRNEDNNISREEFVDGCLKDEVLRQLLAPNV